VVIATVGIYMAFVLLVRLVGQRSLAATASFDLAWSSRLAAAPG
jgi:uncharacterized membrane protein YcaP (DUF421 family)